MLTRQAGGRRINLIDPAQSLFLRKPTTVVPHGGGLKLPVKSPEFAVLADWIASGSPGPKKNDVRIQRLEVFPKTCGTQTERCAVDHRARMVQRWYIVGCHAVGEIQ